MRRKTGGAAGLLLAAFALLWPAQALAVVYAGPKLPEQPGDAPEYKRSRTATADIDEGTGARHAPTPRPTPTRRPGP